MKMVGREAGVSGTDTLPGANRIRFPALRFWAALLFLLPGGLLLYVGLAFLRPWLRRLSAASDRNSPGANERLESSQPDRPEAREPSAHEIEERIAFLELDVWDDPRGFDRVWTPGKWGES